MRKTLIVFGLFVLIGAASAVGQAVYGSIVGTVTDPTGSIVPNAKVTITDKAKGVRFTTTTNETGNYAQQHLIAGRYEVRVDAPGFAASVQDNVGDRKSTRLNSSHVAL